MSISDPPRVVNCAAGDNDAVYIGRPTIWGNPFNIGPCGTRAEVIAKYSAWIMEQPELLALARLELRGRNLACHCAPEACHGDILLRIANA